MPGFAAQVLFSTSSRRPATMIWFPSLWNASASARPIPDPPPVIKMVFDCIFIGVCQSYNRPMHQLQSLLLISLACLPMLAADLAPTGTLRATFLGDNPVQGTVDPTTGAVSGPVADIVKEL